MKFGLVNIKIVNVLLVNKKRPFSTLKKTKQISFCFIAIFCGFFEVKKVLTNPALPNVTFDAPRPIIKTKKRNIASELVTSGKKRSIVSELVTDGKKHGISNEIVTGANKHVYLLEKPEIKINFIGDSKSSIAQITTFCKMITKKIQALPTGGTLLVNEEYLVTLYSNGSVPKNGEALNFCFSHIFHQLKQKNIKVVITQNDTRFQLSKASLHFLNTLPPKGFSTSVDEILNGEKLNQELEPHSRLEWLSPTSSREIFSNIAKAAPVCRIKVNVCFDFSLHMNGEQYPYDMKRHGKGTLNYKRNYQNRLRGFENKNEATEWLVTEHEKMLYEVPTWYSKDNSKNVIVEHLQELLFANLTEYHRFKNQTLFINRWNKMHYYFEDIYRERNIGFHYVSFIDIKEDLNVSAECVEKYNTTFNEIYKPNDISIIDKILRTQIMSKYAMSSQKTFIIKSPGDDILKHCYYPEIFKDFLQ